MNCKNCYQEIVQGNEAYPWVHVISAPEPGMVGRIPCGDNIHSAEPS